MRIISGKYKGRVLTVPKGLPVRPTTDFAKTGLFNILRGRHDLSVLRCLDLFAGTGCISYELASEGCKSIIAIDVSEKCVAFIRKTTELLHETSIQVMRADCFEFLRKTNHRFDLIFADPPFDRTDKAELWKIIRERELLLADGQFILEHQSRERYSELEGYQDTRSYGNVAFSFFANLEAESSQ